MKYDDKLAILNAVLERNGISLGEPDVYDFFYGYRRVFSQEEYDDNGVRHKYSSSVKPVAQKLTPLDFHNSGYFHSEKNLIDWFMYENSGGNPLVWNNIGNPTFDVMDSFVKTRKFMGSIRRSLDGKYYNGEDGNHRLLTLMINHFIARKTAKTPQELQEVDKRFSMTLEVSIPISARLEKFLTRETDRFRGFDNSIFPSLARDYRCRTFPNYRDAYYAATYDEESKMFTYNLNGESFSGTEEELTEFLALKESPYEPIMIWESEGIYYVSCYNKIFKSQSKEKIEEKIKQLKDAYVNGKVEQVELLEIKDIDSNTYEIRLPSVYIEGNQEYAQGIALDVKRYMQTVPEVFLHKLVNADKQSLELIENIDKAYSCLKCFSMPDLIYENLTKEEYLKLKPIIYELSDSIQYVLNSKVEESVD